MSSHLTTGRLGCKVELRNETDTVRAYGDSSPVSLSETTAVEDGMAVFKWIEEMFRGARDRPRVLLWGHSLGTAIATRTLVQVQEEKTGLVSGLVLESPFNKMEDELKHFKTVTWTAWILGTVSLKLFKY